MLQRHRLVYRGHRSGTGFRDFNESLVFMLHVAFCRLDEVGDEVKTSFELNVDLAPRVADYVAEPYELVVKREKDDRADDDDCQ